MKYLPISILAALGLCALSAVARPSHLSDGDERGRSMSSWSSWVPGSGLSMFASADDPWGMQPPPIWRMGEDGHPKPVDTEGPVKKKTPKRKPQQHDQDEEEDDESSERGSSRANASFNAWFPIMLGMYPGNNGLEGEENGARGRPSGRPEGEGVAAIANSVNHGRSGVASSHAIVYSGEPPVNYANRRRSSQPQQPEQQYSQQQPYHSQQPYSNQQPYSSQQPFSNPQQQTQQFQQQPYSTNNQRHYYR
uniref:Unkown protein n=1 Tax=Riptortus pedestris TaxID=329032 RepID=R4WNE8_RIPPE|nr:unkown protein [Riptortus pedestris]